MQNVFRQIISRIYAPRPELNVWQWAEANIRLRPGTTPRPGFYRTDWVPYSRAPQEDFTDPTIHTIVLCWATRSTKTETLLNPIRYSIAHDPQPCMIVMPNDNKGKSFSSRRFQPSINDCPALAAEKPLNPDKFKLSEMQFKRSTVSIVGSNSPANLSEIGIVVLMLDEIDKYPEASRKETGAVQLAKERTKDRWNRKHLIGSTPTVESGQIWVEFLAGDQRYFYIPCPHCRHMQNLRFPQIKWKEDAQDESGNWNLVSVRANTWYECEKCKGEIRDHQKLAMLQKGEWRPTVTTGEPGRRSYHINSLYPEWITFGEIALMFLQSKNNKDELQRFINSWLAEPFAAFGSTEEETKKIVEMESKKRPEGVPEGHKALMFVDVQRDRIYEQVWAFDKEGNGVQLDYACLPEFPEAEVVARKFGCPFVFIDATYAHSQGRVLEWCAAHTGWVPCLASGVVLTPMRWAKMAIDGGLMKGREILSIRWRPHDFKEAWNARILEKRLRTAFLPNLSADFKKQMVGERRAEKKRGSRTVLEWVKIHANHYFDCQIGLLMAFDATRPVLFEVQPAFQQPPPPTEAEQERARTLQDKNQSLFTGEQLDWQ